MATRLAERMGTATNQWPARGWPDRCGASREFHDHRVHRETVSGPGVNLLHHAVALGAQHVLHLHRLDHGERLARLDLLAFGDRDGEDETGHRATQRLAGI